MNTYTVIGLHVHADRKGDIRAATFVQPVVAATPTIAARVARRQMSHDSRGEAKGIQIVAVFTGGHADNYEPILDTEEYERRINLEDAADFEGDLESEED
jgi:hypothetical protein